MIVVSGHFAFTCEPGAALKPERWARQPARLARLDRLSGIALVACDGALLRAQLAGEGALDLSERTAVVFGTAFGCHAVNEEYYRGALREGYAHASPRLFAATLPSSPVGEISIHYQVRGPATTLTSGLEAGLHALDEGARLLGSGRADRVLVVAAEVATPLLSQWLGVPLLDAGAALVLESEALARSRGVVAQPFAAARAVATVASTGFPTTGAVAPLLSFTEKPGAHPSS